MPAPERRPRTRLGFETLEDRTVPSAAAGYATDHVLVTFDKTTPAQAALAKIESSELVSRVSDLGLGIARVDFRAGVALDRAITVFSGYKGVQSVARDSIISVAQTPNDPRLSEVWSLQKIDAATGWNATTGTGQTIVAVVDTGVDYTHPDLAANIWTNAIDPGTGGLHGYDFSDNDTDPMDENGHGTHVAGIVGAVGNNGVGVSGVDQHAKIMVLRFMAADGSGYTSNAVRAIDYAINHGAKIINNSWGGSAADPTLAAAIERARAAGVIVVIAAGNDSANDDTTATYPAYYARNSNNVVLVASTNSSDQLSSFSNYGSQTVKVAAPGESILSTARGGGYVTKSGTSMATPLVSGALALLWDLHPSWTYTQILEKLNTSVDTNSSLSGKVSSAGRINLAKLLDANSASPPTTSPPTTSPPATSPPVSTTPAIRWGGNGPQITSAVFSGSTSSSFNKVRVTFDKKINAATFTPSDVQLSGPSGAIAVASVTAVDSSNNSMFDIAFNSQSATGTYRVVVGPDVWDVQAKRMDQNQNGIGNEASDQFTATARLNGTATSPPVSPPPSSTSARNYAATASNVAIADSRTTRVNFEVTDTFNVSTLAVNLDISHTRMADLEIRLRSPDGRIVQLFNRRTLNLSGVTFDDTATTTLSVGSLAAGALVKPESALAGFGGTAAKGNWTLEIFDLFAGNTGTVRSASLSFRGGAASAKTATTQLKSSFDGLLRTAAGADLRTAQFASPDVGAPRGDIVAGRGKT